MKILFQGDSITDSNRDYGDIHDLGDGYAHYAAGFISEKYPECTFEFVNQGINGNKTEDLLNRVQSDLVDIQPDIVSIMIGINDVWYYSEDREWLSNEVFEERYRTILENIRQKTKAHIMILEPYLMPAEDKLFFRDDLYGKVQIIRKLAYEYADVLVPTEGLIYSSILGVEEQKFIGDGVHPTDFVARVIGKYYCEYIKVIIDKII